MRASGNGAQVGLETVGQGVGLAVVTSVGDETVAERVTARALGFGDGLRRPGVAPTTMHVIAGEPAYAA